MTHRNAELLLRAHMRGHGHAAERAARPSRPHDYSLRERPMGRAWEYWVTRLTKAGELPPRPKSRRKLAASRKSSAKKAKSTRRK